jgi:predicted enzyme related to lactoylglutathione lyase
MIGHISFVTIDSTDPERLAPFWAGLLGTAVGESADEGRFLFLERANGYLLCFQRVPEPKAGKNRVHLDVRVEDLEVATERILSLGGTWNGTDLVLDDTTWRTMRDPEGNEFDIFVSSG